MKAKKFVALMTSVFGLGAIALTISLAFGQKGLRGSFLTRATNPGGNIVFTASDFGSENGDFAKGGVNWHFEGASVSGSIVTMKKIYKTSHAGGTVNDSTF